MIIGIHGKMGVGKSTLAELIMEEARCDAKLIKFASPLYDIQNFIYERTGLTMNGDKDRNLLQWIGNEWGRRKDENLWVNIFRKEVAAAINTLLICDDLRYSNELQCIKELGGITIKVVRYDYEKPTNGGMINHPSEYGIRDQDFDHTINNTGLGRLRTVAKHILYTHGLSN